MCVFKIIVITVFDFNVIKIDNFKIKLNLKKKKNFLFFYKFFDGFYVHNTFIYF